VSRPSNQDIGQKHLERLRRYFKALEDRREDQAGVVPVRNGQANISAIALGAGIPRQVAYRDEAQTIIADAVLRLGFGMPNQQRVETIDLPISVARHVRSLEQQVAVAKAEIGVLRDEVHTLRARLRRFEHLVGQMSRDLAFRSSRC